MRLALGSWALLLGLQAAPALAAGNCWFRPFGTVPGADIALRWVERSGHPCELTLTIRPGVGATEMQVVQQAVNGTAITPSMSTIRYMSRPGFVGHDRFVVERTAEAMARRVIRGTAHWTIDVDVVP